jgi:DNA-binding MarR family transcriptional regulator
MKSFHRETIWSETEQSLDAASLLMEVAPGIMGYIRTEMRRRRIPELSVPHFRALVFLYRHEDASLSQVAEHLGLKLPSTSKIIDALAARKLVVRRQSQKDRRLIRLKLSSSGLNELARTKHSAETCLADILDALSTAELAGIITAFKILKPLFTDKNRMPESTNMKSKTKRSGEINGK